MYNKVAAKAERSYPTSEVRAVGREPGCDGAGTAERSHPVSEVRGNGPGGATVYAARVGGWEEPPHTQGQVAARKINPLSP